MKKNKKKTILIITLIITLVAALFFASLYYITSTVNNYTYTEKNWMTDNINTTIDVYVEKDLPIFSYSGKGVYFDYLDALKEDTGLSLNIVATDSGKYKLSCKNSIDDNDVLLYKDHYIVAGTGDALNVLTDLSYKNVGIIKTDKDAVSYYLTELKDVKYNEYSSFEELKAAYTSKSIDYMVIPMYKYMNNIIKSDYNILFHLDGLYSYYAISLDPDNKELSSIVTKFYYRWKDKAEDKRNEYFLDMYFTSENYSELDKESITNDDFTIGYISNLPYEGMIRKEFTGLTNTYLSKFSNMTGVTYKYLEFENVEALTDGLASGKVDLALNYYSVSNDKYSSSRNLGTTEYVVLAHIDNNIVVNSLYSLTSSNVVMLSNMNLMYNMASKNLFEIKDYSNINLMLKNIDEESVIIIEKEVFDYFKDSKLKNYTIRFSSTIKLNNSFLLNKSNEAFNKLFDYYLSTISVNEVKNESIEGIINTLRNNRVFTFIMNNLLYIVGSLLVVGFATYAVVRKIASNNKVKREDRLMYFDTMTNLKNRNYLNANIDFWSSTKVYPQAIIIIDINKLKTLNDKYGHEIGDSQIRSVASVLIKTQRDNSEILRTDGDEFMVYLVGYEEKRVSSYIHKLNKEIVATLPNRDYGISIGYSMINNELSTLDDAINDALMMIKKTKGEPEE